MSNPGRKRLLLMMAISFVLGALWLLTVRFAAYNDGGTHYHANFALYINGQREQFDNFSFYEEVQSCNGDQINNPKTRVHMHDMINHVVHVHDPAATWGHLFANLGFVLGNDLIETDHGLFKAGSGAKLTFVLNGKETGSIANETIRSEDVLLINYGNEDTATINSRYEGITKDAAQYNQSNDPSACTGGQPLGFRERLEAAARFWE